MRVIWYMLDALTPCVLRAFNSEKGDSEELAPFNFIDELSKNSFIINKCYGYGETMASNSAMITGMNSRAIKSDMLAHPKSFQLRPTLASYFKENGFSTVFYRNFPLDGLRRHGPYKRYNILASKGFDHVCIEDDSNLLLKDSKIIKQQDDFFLIKSSQPTFIFIHDMAFHDDSLVLRDATKEGIFEAVIKKSERVRNNLEYLNYNQETDVLIFSSDHGMTLSPYDDLFYDKNISIDTLNRYWPKLTADFKLKTCFFIKGPGITPGKAIGTFEIRDMFATVLDFLHIKYTQTGAVSAKSQTRSSALVSIAGASSERMAWKWLKNWFHPYIIYIDDDKKWIYRKSKQAKCYYIDLKLDPKEDSPATIVFSEFPLEFKKYIKEYFSIGKILYRFFYAYHPKRVIIYFAKKSILKFKQLYNFIKILKINN